MIYLHKIIPLIVLPLGLTFILVLAGIAFRKRFLCATGLVLLWLSATPAVSDLVMRSVEGWEVRRSVDELPNADAIAVLGGGRILAPGNPSPSEWTNADRFFGGIELYRAGKAPLLIFTGGWVPWHPLAEPEGQILIRYAEDFGIQPDALMTTDKVVNTQEEAVKIAELLGVEEQKKALATVLLVTSAYHMRRSILHFERAGLRVIPFPVDFQVSVGKKVTILDFLPQSKALRKAETALREIYGYLYFRVMG